jgi:hypothetical protein
MVLCNLSLLEWAAMFSRRLRGLSAGLLIMAALITLLAAACGGDGKEASTTPAATSTAASADTPTPSATNTATPGGADETPIATALSATIAAQGVTPSASPNPIADIVATYVGDTGLGGKTYELSQIVNCKGIVEEADMKAAEGKVCIHFANSQFGDTTGVAEVWVYGTGAVWKLHFERQDGAWVVVSAEETSPTATPSP